MTKIKLEPITTSSQIIGLGYQNEVIAVQFTNGDTWEYSGASPELYENLKNASSIGKFFIANVKKNLQGKKV
jgi:hypothetical protein